jgi:hypothetical protein
MELSTLRTLELYVWDDAMPASQYAVIWSWICACLPGLLKLHVTDQDKALFKFLLSETCRFRTTLREFRVLGASLEPSEVFCIPELCPILTVLQADCKRDFRLDTTLKLLTQHPRLVDVSLSQWFWQHNEEALMLMNKYLSQGNLFPEKAPSCPLSLWPLIFAHADKAPYHQKLVDLEECETLMDGATAVFGLLKEGNRYFLTSDTK